jgi:hypothetical protein
MTGRAIDASHVHMQRMIELHAEASQARKRFQGAGLHVGVADGANRAVRIRKLLRMTTRARQVSRSPWSFWHRSICIASVTKQAGETRMIAAAVLKF